MNRAHSWKRQCHYGGGVGDDDDDDDDDKVVSGEQCTQLEKAVE